MVWPVLALYLKVTREKTLVVSIAGKYEKLPEGETTKASNLLEKGTNLSVETKEGTTQRVL